MYADDKVVITVDEDNIIYMFLKLKEEYEKWCLAVSLLKTEYSKSGGNDVKTKGITGNNAVEVDSKLKTKG